MFHPTSRYSCPISFHPRVYGLSCLVYIFLSSQFLSFSFLSLISLVVSVPGWVSSRSVFLGSWLAPLIPSAPFLPSASASRPDYLLLLLHYYLRNCARAYYKFNITFVQIVLPFVPLRGLELPLSEWSDFARLSSIRSRPS